MDAPIDDSKYPDSYPYGTTPPRYGTRQAGKEGKVPLYVLAWRIPIRDIVPGPNGVGVGCSGLAWDFAEAWSDNVRVSPAKTVFMEPSVRPYIGGLKDRNVYYIVATNGASNLSRLTEEDMDYTRKALPEIRKRHRMEGSVEDQLAWYRRHPV
ncbi:hypothetical protein MKEN_00146800 [Mycena kentingensis (nom. inval.)]|nr:hypothetical protein MKEN_00146800 [Mycena kentingensis (nom. inval.)]